MCALLHIDETQLATGVCYFSLDLVKLQYFAPLLFHSLYQGEPGEQLHLFPKHTSGSLGHQLMCMLVHVSPEHK